MEEEEDEVYGGEIPDEGEMEGDATCPLPTMTPPQRLLNSLLGQDAKRFIKRKDSDAGETGGALEELRSSLYNVSFELQKEPSANNNGFVDQL